MVYLVAWMFFDCNFYNLYDYKFVFLGFLTDHKFSIALTLELI